MRITTFVRKNTFIYYFFLLCFCTSIQSAYSQCPTVTNAAQSFCDTQFPVVGSLLATDEGGGVRWYANVTGGSALTNLTPLQNGQDYFADDNTGSCGLRQVVIVTIYAAPTGSAFQGPCVENANDATLADFFVSGNAIKWYSSPSFFSPYQIIFN